MMKVVEALVMMMISNAAWRASISVSFSMVLVYGYLY